LRLATWHEGSARSGGNRGRSRDYAPKLAEKEQLSSGEAVEQTRREGMQEMSKKFHAMGGEVYVEEGVSRPAFDPKQTTGIRAPWLGRAETGFASRRGVERSKSFVLAALSITKDPHRHEG
jgi:hypothetical protein